MIPILFGPEDGLTNGFTTNGKGRLSSCSRCEVTESDENLFELEMEYPMSGPHFNELRTGNIIGAVPFQNGKIQGFEIYKTTKPIGGVSTIYARHVSYRLADTPVNKFSADNIQNAITKQINLNAFEPCPFTFETEFSNQDSFVSALPMSVRDLLVGEDQSIQRRYGGEFEWDNYTVRHKKTRGSDKGAVIRYGVNLIDLTQETNIEETITGVYVYWRHSDGDKKEAYVALEAPVQSENASKFPYHKTKIIDISREFNDIPTNEQMIEWCNNYIKENNVGVPVVSVTVSFVDMKNVFEYQNLKSVPSINLGDTVTVIFEKLGISVKARVNQTVWDVLRERYSSIDVGERKQTLTNQMVETSILADTAVTETKLSKSIDRATGVLNAGSRGHVIVGRSPEGWSNEIFFLDDENLSKAKQVLRINKNGIGFSSEGIDGPYPQTWDLFGHMTLGGVNNSYGDFKILTSGSIPTVHMDQYGLRLWRIAAIGYLDNGKMYKDQDKTEELEVKKDECYYDPSDSSFYIWTGSEFKTPEGAEGLNARMTTDGLGLYKGEIDLRWNGKRGLYVGKTKIPKPSSGETDPDDDDDDDEDKEEYEEIDAIYVGDFMVNEEYGRQIFESSDEATGMSGKPDSEEGYYLWAGWDRETDMATFSVNDAGEVVINGALYVNGSIYLNDHPISASSSGGGPNTSDSGDDPPTGPGAEG